MGETTISSLADLRPGDLMFTRINKPLSASIIVKFGQLVNGERVRIGPLSVDHVGIVTSAGEWPHLVQAMPSGAEEIALTPGRHWNAGTAYARLPEAWPGQAADAAAIAQLMIGTPYSFASYAAIAAWRFGLKAGRLERWIDRRRPGALELPRWSNGPAGELAAWTRGGRLPVEAICSVLADQAWSLAGARVVTGTARQVVTPGKLALQLWRRPGVIWGGAGIAG
jgi:hypothetical protein